MPSSGILNIFAESPIKPMQKHMDQIYGCVALLIPFFQHVIHGEWELSKNQHEQIMSLESKADEIKKEIRLHLPSNLFMPIARSDLLGLLTVQDKIASKAKHITSVVFGRRMVFPAYIADSYCNLVQRAVDCAEQAARLIHELDELIETGFRGREVKLVERMILDLDEIERQTDRMQVALRERLFTMEKSLDPIDVIFLYKIIDWTGELADRAQHVGHRLDTILAQ